MDHPTALLTDLGNSLEDALDPDGPAVSESLAVLIASLSTAVASYCGLELTLTEHGYPVILTQFRRPPPASPRSDDLRPDRVVTSLRLPLLLLDPDFEVGSRIVFYAATLGAFVDLAADLTYALAPPHREGPPPTGRAGSDDRIATGVTAQSTAVVLDIDLPPTRRSSTVSGLAELVTINHAVGVMIDRGHHPDDVHHSLRRQAAAAGLSPYAFAVRLLQG